MSLFISREIWSSQCGRDECYDDGCMVVADISSPGIDCIITGSQSGLIQIFQPQSDSESDPEGFRPTDLLIEMLLPNPVLQLAVGKLVSGSQNKHIGVLHPRSVAVFSLVAVSGSAHHGDQYELVLAYEHQLTKSAFSFIIGPFGSVKGRDFICVQSIDGTLSFFEQETFAVSRTLTCFLLPSPMVYVSTSDSFIIHNANWVLECFRYEVLADPNRKLVPTWSLNLGEPVVDLKVVTTQGSKVAIVVLAERNLYCLREGGGVDLAKRLQFTPCALHPYVTEPDRRLMVLVVADTAVLLVYDLSTLCWSSQLPFVPVVISRVNIKSILGLIALLSEEGQVVCCYLGTEPSVFMPPPLPTKALGYNDLQNKLVALQRQIDSASQNAALKMNEGHEVSVVCRVLATADPSLCQLMVKLTPALTLNNLQVTVSVTPPLTAHPTTYHLLSLGDPAELSSLITFSSSHPVCLYSADVHVITTYVSNSGTPRVLNVTSVLPISLVLLPSEPSKEAEHKITLALSHLAVPLNQLFAELLGEEWQNSGCSENVVGLCHRNLPEESTTIVMSKSSPRYRIQGDNMAAMSLVISQLIVRLESYYLTRHKPVSVTYTGTSLPTGELLAAVDRHTELRNTIVSLQEKLGQQTTQHRTIQRRLLSKLRERTVLPLVGLDRLLTDTHKVIVNISHKIEDTQLALELCKCELGCLIRLVLLLCKLGDSTGLKDWTDLAAAMSYVQHHSENQGWEEVCESGVNYLLSTSLAKSVRDHQRTNIDPLKDTSRFKKHITVALDRVMAGTGLQVKEELRGVSPIMEGEEDHGSASQSRRNSLKLLPARKSLQPLVEKKLKSPTKVLNTEDGETTW